MTDNVRTQINKAKVVEMLKRNFGNVRVACSEACVSKTQFYKWRQNDANFNAKVLSVYTGIYNYSIVKSIKLINESKIEELTELRKKAVKRLNIQ